jgi:ankyrin repeat protein
MRERRLDYLFLLLSILCTAPAGMAHGRPLTAEETRIFRAAPPFGETNKTPDSLKRFQAASALAHKLAMEGSVEAVPLLVELRHIPLLTTFAGSYSGQATPELEALALRSIDSDPELAARLVAMLRKLRSPELFDALLKALPEARIDCAVLLGAAADADLPDEAVSVESRLVQLLPVLHPAFGRYIAKRLVDSEFVAGEKPLIDLLRRASLDRISTISSLARQIVRFPSDASINAVARKLVEVAALPEDKAPPKAIHIRNEDIPQDGLLCSTEMLRAPFPLGDARSREVAELLRILAYAFPVAALDPGIFGQDTLDRFSTAERAALDAMLAERARTEARARDLTPENLLYWLSADRRMVKQLIARGIDVNRTTGFGERPLVSAARGVHAEAVELMLEAGADPHLADAEGNTALHAVSGHTGNMPSVIAMGEHIVKLLLEKGAAPGARNRNGATPLQLAAGHRPELARLLLDAGAPVNIADKNGATPLHRAVQGRQAVLVRELLDRGANVNAEEQGGVTPLLIARDNGDRELEQLLGSRGGRINQVYYLQREAFKLLYTKPDNRH